LQAAAVVTDILGFFRRRPNFAPTYSTSDLVAVSLVAAVVAVWIEAAGGSFSLRALVACEAVFLVFYLAGSLFSAWRGLAAGVLFDLPLRLLVGYAVVNTALLGLAWLSPLGIVANFGILLAITVALFVAARPAHEEAGSSVGLLVLALSLAAATLWCQDSIRPIAFEENAVVFKPWVDGFYSAVHIRLFGESHGAASIEDFRLAGVSTRPYHYGVYLTPAFIRQASGIHSYTAFAAILAPVGVLFTGLAAYAFVGSFLGAWPGLAACAALLLLPDGAQQGMHNTFMSYRWLTQISPSTSYGLALLAVAWIFVMRGCTQGNRLQILAGWLVAGVLAAYKLHFFIASALLFWLLPPLFFRGKLGLSRRVLWASVAFVVFAVTIILVQKVPGVPVIRFDGSGVGKILTLVKGFTQPGALRDFLAERIGKDHTVIANLLYGVPFVFLAALGVFVPLLGFLVLRLRRRTSALFVLFPLLLLANFLAMFFGLALDSRSSTPEELSHRPMMVMYFLVVAWLGGASGFLLIESRRLGRFARPAIVGLAIALMAVPAFFGAGVQRMWLMRSFSPVRVPIGLFRAAEYLREHSSARDLFQDSQFDRTYAVASISERRAYVARTMTRMSYHNDLVEERAEAIDQFTDLRDSAAIVSTARKLGFTWFLLNPGDRILWPKEFAGRPAFELGGYRLYRF
jgi:hypothetical protein